MRVAAARGYDDPVDTHGGDIMPAIILWLLGVPITVIILLYLVGVF